MRILLESGDAYYVAYWAKRTPSTVVGWVGPASLGALMAPSLKNLADVHFTYPADGRLHYTFSCRDDTGRLTRVRNVYSDTYREKALFPDGTTQKWHGPRDHIAPEDLMVPVYDPPALADYATGAHQFHFMVAAIPSITEGRWPRQYQRVDRVEDDDLVVSADPNKAGTLNLSAWLAGNGCPRYEAKGDEVVTVKALEDRYPHLIMQCLFVLTRTEVSNGP